ncbi:MAG: thiamine pyrophosphate-binding protein, partial [Chloroflexi bacterium]|nr:thiamine pyrophosphate-binding protein [Chloroflexota bacterium]
VADTARAARRARVERRAVVLMLPLDVQAATVEAAGAAVTPAPLLRPVRPAAASVQEAARALSEARWPLIIGGRGAVIAGAGPAPRASRRSGWGWPRRSAPRWPVRTGSRSPPSATAVR